MDKAQFWKLIEESNAVSDGDCYKQADALLNLLKRLSGDEIIAFETLFYEFRKRAYRWDLWGAAYLINGGASDDGFEYFRWWLIGQGEQVYEAALRDPDSLAEIVDPKRDDYECEEILYCVSDAYEAITGQEMPETPRPNAITDAENYAAPEPVGQRWEEDELDNLYPRLTALYEQADNEAKDETNP